jgi:signal peptidase I
MRTPLHRLPHGVRVVVDWLLTIVFAVGVVLAVKTWVVNPYRIPSSSMEPTLHCARPGFKCEAGISDRVLAARFIYHFRDPKRGDVIVFDTPPAAATKCGMGGTYVKRLIALPGETWQERDGVVYIDGKRLAEPYLRADRRDHETHPRRTIPPGHYFFMGDNRQWSCDSRKWGTVPRANLIGKVVARYWPPQRIGFG